MIYGISGNLGIRGNEESITCSQNYGRQNSNSTSPPEKEGLSEKRNEDELRDEWPTVQQRKHFL
jgi:hypothetical protein